MWHFWGAGEVGSKLGGESRGSGWGWGVDGTYILTHGFVH